MTTTATAPHAGRSRIVVNALLFQAGWFACVLGAAGGIPTLGLYAAVVVIGWHLFRAANPGPEASLVAVAVIAGLIFETALLHTGLLTFESGVWIDGIAPIWMVALWAMFATTLNVSLRWMRSRAWVAAVFGFLGGPLAYYGGAQLGALQFIMAGPVFVFIAVGWAIITPLLMQAAQRMDGYAKR
jgi:hypothetical protein